MTDESAIDVKIAYHREMEYISNRAGDFTQAEHHQKMQEIFRAMKERQPSETPEQASDED